VALSPCRQSERAAYSPFVALRVQNAKSGMHLKNAVAKAICEEIVFGIHCNPRARRQDGSEVVFGKFAVR
jgi:ribosomal protein L14